MRGVFATALRQQRDSNDFLRLNFSDLLILHTTGQCKKKATRRQRPRLFSGCAMQDAMSDCDREGLASRNIDRSMISNIHHTHLHYEVRIHRT
jgi:hypothetical protein